MHSTHSTRTKQSGDQSEERDTRLARHRAGAVTAASAAGWSVDAAPAQVLALQRAIGNTAVGKLVGSGPTVQRADDPQRVLTKEDWQEKAGARGASAGAVAKNEAIIKSANTRSAGTWKKGEPRVMTTVLQQVGKGLLEDLATRKESGQLKLYRAMSRVEADGILAYFGDDKHRPARTEEFIRSGAGDSGKYKKEIGAMSMGKHLGDYKQAHEYRKQKGPEHAVMLEFTLKPGAHEVLFTPQYMALGPSLKSEYIRAAHPSGTHPNAQGAEGTLPGYIGVKAETNEGPFSLSIAGKKPKGNGKHDPGASELLFQLFVESVKEMGPAA